MTVTVAGREVALDPRRLLALALAEVDRTPRALKAWYALLLGMMAVGAAGAVFTIIPGAETFGTTPSFEWGLLISAYVLFAITTSGLCLGSSLWTVFGIPLFRPLEKRHAILAILSLSTAFGIIALDLHYPVRMVFGAVFNPSLASPMWWMGFFYAMYLVFLIVELWSMFFDHHVVHKYACLASSCTAVLAPSTLGAVFGVLLARSYWYGLFTPIAMLATALLAGSALMGIAFLAVVRLRLDAWERTERLGIPAVRILLVVALVLSVLLLVRGLAVGLMSDDPLLREAVMAQLTGPLAIPFWGRVLFGIAVPLALLVLPRTRTVTGTGIASVLAFVGVVVDRLVFVSAGQIIPATTVGGVVSDPYVLYVPSPVEIAIVIGAFGFIGFMVTLSERYLDMTEPAVHSGFHVPAFVRTAWTGWRRPAPAATAPEAVIAAASPLVGTAAPADLAPDVVVAAVEDPAADDEAAATVVALAAVEDAAAAVEDAAAGDEATAVVDDPAAVLETSTLPSEPEPAEST